MRSVAKFMNTLGLVLMILVSASPVVGADDTLQTENRIRFFGKAIFNTHYDTAIQAYDFSSYLINDTEEEFNFNPRDTRLGFVASHEAGDWSYSAVYETDFYGDNNGNSMLPRMRLGYVRAENSSGLSITGGQDWIPIAQQNPGCIDFGIMSWSGNMWSRVPQMTFRYASHSSNYMLGIMKHRISNNQEMQEVMPWLMGRAEIVDIIVPECAFAIGGGWRSVNVDGYDYTPSIIAGEFVIPVNTFIISGEGYCSKGAGREFVHYGYDYNPAHASGPSEIVSKGGFINLHIPVGRMYSLDLGWGLDDPRDGDLEGRPEVAYLANRSGYIALRKAITQHFGYGAELVSFITKVRSGAELSGERFTTSWWYRF